MAITGAARIGLPTHHVRQHRETIQCLIVCAFFLCCSAMLVYFQCQLRQQKGNKISTKFEYSLI